MREEFRVSAASNRADTRCSPAHWPDWQVSSKMSGLLGNVSSLGDLSTVQQRDEGPTAAQGGIAVSWHAPCNVLGDSQRSLVRGTK
jgi:hypothetical protein